MRLTIYSKPGCHLCDEMKATVARTIEGRVRPVYFGGSILMAGSLKRE